MGIMHFWNQGDIVTHSIAVVLAILSLLSWAIIGSRFFAQMKLNRSIDQAFDAFWGAADLEHGLAAIRATDASGLFAGMAETAAHVVPFVRDKLDTPDPQFLAEKLVVLAVGAALYALLTLGACRRAQSLFKKQDL